MAPEGDCKSTCNIIIVGAGIGGLTAAITIRRAGFSVTVLEQAGELSEIGAGIELSPNASRVLAGYGVLPDLERLAIKAPNLYMRSYRTGAILSTTPLGPELESRYGAPHMCIHRADLQRVLYEAAKDSGAEILFKAEVTDIEFSRKRDQEDAFMDKNSQVAVIVNRERRVYGHCIIGADGQLSVCRTLMLGAPDPPRRSGDITYRLTLPAQFLYERPNLRFLVDPADINSWFGPQSHVVGYLLKKDNLFNLFLGGPDSANTTDKIPPPQMAPVEEARAMWQEWDPVICELLEGVQTLPKWTLVRLSDLDHWTHESGKMALLGDAAHGMLPYMGQGAAQAIEDAGFIGTLLSHVEHARQIPDMLSIYEQVRRSRALYVKRRAWEMRPTFGYPDGPMQRERDRQMALEPFEGCPNPTVDPVLQKWLWGHDIFSEAEKAWQKYEDGLFPHTMGKQLFVGID